MAHDVLIAGALFPDVPSVQLPDSQQQWHSFTDVSDTTAAAADVAQGKQFYDASGVLTQGTSSGGGGSDADLKALIERSGSITRLPDGLTKIGDCAFYGYSDLAVESLPNGIVSIGNNAFNGCTGITSMSIPDSVTTIGNSAFSGCSNLESLTLPSRIESLPSNMARICSSLTSVTIPETVKTIGDSAFSGCFSLSLSRLPSTVTSIENYAFSSCDSITSISCDGAISTLGVYAFQTTYSRGHPTAIESAFFPNMTVSSLGTVFGGTSSGWAAQRLETIDIGKTQSIAANAFYSCYKLQTLVLRRTDAICSLANVSAFTNTPMRGYSSRSGTIYVPSALIETYKTATNWKTIYDAGHLTFAAIEGSEWEL